ncbi:hypothetical protein [Paenibacillus azoreducens]|uniref:Uncharacterized protein n=1 Tax=Paenibacillus azoreducens TaxID=116718 RepID=A0A919Y8B0_9BACL|nr:hypothetical protein [Paenibacillus azoreducens]GIO46821.1 hypothetical protein J34TS1_15860 [Paenibacillus azoreducens]
MGSSGYSGGSYGGAGGGAVNKCGDTLIIQIIVNQNQGSIWYNTAVSDDVYINLNKTSILPKIEVLKIDDNTLVGVAPPSYGWVINCIENGWKYQGVILKKEGTEYDPRVTVQLSGVK